MLTGCWQQQPVNITHNYTSCCIYTVDPPHDEQQACSKHVEAYYWNKLIENSASCWFILYEFLPSDFDICRYTKLGISLGDRKTRNSAMMFCLCVPYARHNGLPTNCQVWREVTKSFLHSENLIFIQEETFLGSVKFAWVRILSRCNSIRNVLWLIFLLMFLHMRTVRTSNVS
jgi:hypothetical protein